MEEIFIRNGDVKLMEHGMEERQLHVIRLIMILIYDMSSTKRFVVTQNQQIHSV